MPSTSTLMNASLLLLFSSIIPLHDNLIAAADDDNVFHSFHQSSLTHSLLSIPSNYALWRRKSSRKSQILSIVRKLGKSHQELIHRWILSFIHKIRRLDRQSFVSIYCVISLHFRRQFSHHGSNFITSHSGCRRINFIRSASM